MLLAVVAAASFAGSRQAAPDAARLAVRAAPLRLRRAARIRCAEGAGLDPAGAAARTGAAVGPEGYRLPDHAWLTRPNPEYFFAEEENDWLVTAAAAVASHSAVLLPAFSALRQRPFFRYYGVDLLASCGYVPQSESPCELNKCEIEPSYDVPDAMLNRDRDEYEFELDSWGRWDTPSDFTEYYDLAENAEKNTGYNGSGVWRFVHQKICFQDDLDLPQNSWKRDFNRGVAGLHSCVSASIIRDILDTDGDEQKALAEYRRRLRDEPGFLNNMYFTTALCLGAVEAITPRVTKCSFIGDAANCLPHVLAITSSPIMHDPALTRAAAQMRQHTDSPDAAPWKMRLRTRDLLGLMNCVQCNLCRLHGKVMVAGFAASLQVLLGFTGRGDRYNKISDPYSLHRVEVACLITTAGKLVSACETVELMRALDKRSTEGAAGEGAAGKGKEAAGLA